LRLVIEIIDYLVVARGGIEPPTHGFSVRRFKASTYWYKVIYFVNYILCRTNV